MSAPSVADDWRAKQRGDVLPAGAVDMLTVWAGLCALDCAIWDGQEMLPELPP